MLMLTTLSVAIVVIFDANPTKLIELYVVGVFLSLTLSQLGMIITHWTKRFKSVRPLKPMVHLQVRNSCGLCKNLE